MPSIEIPVARTRWPVVVRAADLIALPRPAASAIADVRSAVLDALDHPRRFEPLRRALTPDDRIALVVDESLPQLAELIAGVLEYLAGTGIPPAAVTAIGPAGSAQHWIADLPEKFADLQTEVHQPADRNRLSYLATTKDGRRVYLNRTLVDADQSIILTGRGYDSLVGYSGALEAIYPRLADADIGKSLTVRVAPQTEPTSAAPTMAEAVETGWLLGSPFFVQVIEGNGDEIAAVVSGLTESAADGVDLLNERWKATIGECVDTVIASLTGDPSRHDFAALARAALCAARVVKPGGQVIILSEADPELGPATAVLRRCDEPPEAVKLLLRERPADAPAAIDWCWAASRAKIHLASEIRPTTVEEMFATPINGPRDVQRLADAPGKCLIVPDAHKSWVTVS